MTVRRWCFLKFSLKGEMIMKKDVYSIYPSTYGDVQIRKNNKTEINIVAVFIIEGNGKYCTNQDRKTALRLARKTVKTLNGE